VWGSEFTTKTATLQGDSADFAARLNIKFWDLRACSPPFWNSWAYQKQLSPRFELRNKHNTQHTGVKKKTLLN
jgi:hypothetical protein